VAVPLIKKNNFENPLYILPFFLLKIHVCITVSWKNFFLSILLLFIKNSILLRELSNFYLERWNYRINPKKNAIFQKVVLL